MSIEPRKNFTLKEFCEHRRCSLSHVYNQIAAGKLIAVKDGAKTIITAQEAERYQASLPPIGLLPVLWTPRLGVS
ncbi:hypothetical protein [Bosea sp. (in: a-proteobacteria)]|uniref:hypothetical protein n=1 Tax=Bosea sp. (in: a-proteobacteria) TaxID=1871050 RepID=UPI003F6FA9E6